MAVVPICYKLHCKDQILSIPRGFKKNEGLVTSSIFSRDVADTDCCLKQKSRKWMDVLEHLIHVKSSTPFQTMSRASLHDMHQVTSRSHFSSDGSSEKKQNLDRSSAKKQLLSLDSYFRKLRNSPNQLESFKKRAELFDGSWQSSAEKELAFLNDYLHKLNNSTAAVFDLSEAEKGLESLDSYLGKISKDANPADNVACALYTESTETTRHTLKQGYGHEKEKVESYFGLENTDGPEFSYDDTSNLYLIGVLSAINIAVFLFEAATPVRNSDLELFSLPLLYGAKINDSILLGEWWRLVTPMFLHWGIHHVALGCWMLFTFGPQVCRAYGSFTFIMLYVLGGLSGNFTSFIHTPEPTVGGTGPVFAILGAWFICQILNRDALGKVNSESMIQKAMVATALSCILSNFGPIDDWTHFGAAFSGIAYGFLTCPILQMRNASSTIEEEGIALVRRNVGPCRSLLFFSLFLLVLGSLGFIVEPPLQ